MHNHALSDALWSEGLASENPQAAASRRSYASKRAAQEARERQLALSEVIQTDILPRLMLLHPAFALEAEKPCPKADVALVAEFTNVVLAQDAPTLFTYFTDLLSKGYSADALFLDLLAPAAALLGRLWDEDLCDFIEVTTGVARLQALLSMFHAGGGVPLSGDNRRILLMGAPGEQHTFGVAVVEQFLRSAGWQVASGLASDPRQIADLVEREWFGVVGLTLSCSSRIASLSEAITSVRHASRNRAIGVMVGGPVFLENPDLVRQVGADASAIDAPTAVLLAQMLVDLNTGKGRPATP
ncbi:hypothetical protein OCOJLMKI_0666 [Methylobacterium iners]|uniref:B12-binding domain-containing protein n=1 Tax=Methylobacterium iners TaxID=418707 RepID=A0ABQ4RRS1_9HYPH|nr:hypothetical protein OCOJLMKI_0666 [Methylobacterium iners]